MDIESLHNILIILHSASATLSFFAGIFLMFSPVSIPDQRFFRLYGWALVGMVILLAGAIVVYWGQYSSTERIIFPGLFVLGIYMLYRAQGANRLLKSQQPEWEGVYLEHIGFTLISLFEGFVIVSGLHSGFPVWLVALFAILGVLLGRALIGFAQRKVE
jgi:membrane-associated HD superfamily phosphohydrolase